LYLRIAFEIKKGILADSLSVKYSIKEILTAVGCTTLEISNYKRLEMEKEKLLNSLLKLKYYRTRNKIASILEGYPIYITDIFDIRLRMYPREH